jgi:hypothetical protein
MTITRPLRLMTLHFSQIGFTDALTFMFVPLFVSLLLLSTPCAEAQSRE